MALYTPQGLPYLGGFKFGSAAVSSGAITIPTVDVLWIYVVVTGYSGGDVASLRFNGDTGPNYRTQHIAFSTAATTVGTSTARISQTVAPLFANTTTQQRNAVVTVNNNLGTSKLGQISGTTSTGSAATSGILELAALEWVNTTAPITSVELRTLGGSITLSVGSHISIYGRTIA